MNAAIESLDLNSRPADNGPAFPEFLRDVFARADVNSKVHSAVLDAVESEVPSGQHLHAVADRIETDNTRAAMAYAIRNLVRSMIDGEGDMTMIRMRLFAETLRECFDEQCYGAHRAAEEIFASLEDTFAATPPEIVEQLRAELAL